MIRCTRSGRFSDSQYVQICYLNYLEFVQIIVVYSDIFKKSSRIVNCFICWYFLRHRCLRHCDSFLHTIGLFWNIASLQGFLISSLTLHYLKTSKSIPSISDLQPSTIGKQQAKLDLFPVQDSARFSDNAHSLKSVAKHERRVHEL